MADSGIIVTVMQTLKLLELLPVLNSSTVTEPSLSLTATLGALNSTVIGATSEQTHKSNHT